MKKKFVLSYSGGKDSMLALYRCVKAGHEPLALVTTYNTVEEKSWFHNIPKHTMEEVGRQLGIPILFIKTDGEDYNEAFEETLKECKRDGASFCAFGDIDISGHLDWGKERCKKAGLDACFPLWQEDRESLVYEFMEVGFTTLLTVVDTSRLGEEFLGKNLTPELAEAVKAAGADICGEEGEYHTVVLDGPLFKAPVKPEYGEIVRKGNYSYLPIL